MSANTRYRISGALASKNASNSLTGVFGAMLDTFNTLDVRLSIENCPNLTNAASTIPALASSDLRGDPCLKLAGDRSKPGGTTTMLFLPTMLFLGEKNDDGVLKATALLLFWNAAGWDNPPTGDVPFDLLLT